MSWTVACFCGHLFSTPANACPSCGEALPDVSRHREPAAPPIPAFPTLVGSRTLPPRRQLVEAGRS